MEKIKEKNVVRKRLDPKVIAKAKELELIEKINNQYIFKTKQGYYVQGKLSQLKNDRNLRIFHQSNPHTLKNIIIWTKSNENIHKLELLEDKYISSITKMKWKCISGHEVDISWNAVQSGNGCRYCTDDEKYTINQASNIFKNNNLTLLSDVYDGVFGNLLSIDKYGYKYNINLHTLLNNYKPIPFTFFNPYTIENINHWLKNYAEDADKYTLVSIKFKTVAKDKLEWNCLEHGKFKMTWNNFYKHGARCPQCNNSKGERKINEVLLNKKFNLMLQDDFEELFKVNPQILLDNVCISQKEFDGLFGVGGGLLSYDSYIPKYNLLIEFQGEQHERYIKGFHKSKKYFERQVEHDKRKRQYAKDNNIKLLEIWYFDIENIEEIINNILK